MELKVLINKMLDGDREAILLGFESDSCLGNLNAIIGSTVFNYTDDWIVENIKKFSKDKRFVFDNAGTMISDFAYAALHVLNVATYDGNRVEVTELIDCKLRIYTPDAIQSGL